MVRDGSENGGASVIRLKTLFSKQLICVHLKKNKISEIAFGGFCISSSPCCPFFFSTLGAAPGVWYQMSLYSESNEVPFQTFHLCLLSSDLNTRVVKVEHLSSHCLNAAHQLFLMFHLCNTQPHDIPGRHDNTSISQTKNEIDIWSNNEITPDCTPSIKMINIIKLIYTHEKKKFIFLMFYQ